MPTVLLTDSGLETWLIFHRGVELADFAAFPLLQEPGGRAQLAEYFCDHLRIGAQAGTGVVLETPTWRASADWGWRLGYDADALDSVNRDAVSFLLILGQGFPTVELTVSGLIGPRGDGYNLAVSAATSGASPRNGFLQGKSGLDRSAGSGGLMIPTAFPSGSSTIAYLAPQNASYGGCWPG